MIRGHKNISKSDILVVKSEKDLFEQYCPNFHELDTPFISDLRIGDDHPSCRITDLGSGLRYKDFGLDNPATDVWGYIGLKYSLAYHQVLEKVASDLGIEPSNHRNLESIPTMPNVIEKLKVNTNRTQITIRIKKRDWLISDKQYWYDRYGITKAILNKFNVVPISNFWLEGGKFGDNSFMYESELHSYCYNYYWNEGIFRRKIYQPYSTTQRKWFSNIDTTIVQGITNIPKIADLLIVTKSLKDVMIFDMLGYPSVAPNNEHSWLPIEVWRKFEARYTHKTIFFDNDEAGLASATKRALEYNLIFKHIPIELLSNGIKDISDYREKFGADATIKFVRQMLRD